MKNHRTVRHHLLQNETNYFKMAVNIDLKFATLQNPEDCPLEELKAQIEDLESKVGFYETKQLAIKKFINSVYGALGSKYFVAYNTAMAESITAQGRDLNHFTEISVNQYFEGMFQSNPEIEVYYQWQHTDKDGKNWTFKHDDKPEDYYQSGKWVECKSWEAAVKKGKKMTSELKDAYYDNSVHKCDWCKIKTNLWDKMCLIHEKCRDFDISKGKTTQTGPLVGPEFEYLNGKTESMTVAGDTDSIYVEAGRIITYCAPKSIYWGVSEETQQKVYHLCGKYPENINEIPDERLKNEIHKERRMFETKAVLDLWDYSLGPYMEKKYEYYSDKYNCDKNLQVLELEKISDTSILLAKKNYCMSICYSEGSGITSETHLTSKGLPTVKGGTPSYSREKMIDFLEYVIGWFRNHTEPMPYENIIEKLRDYKKIFMTRSPEEICNGVSITNYEKYILDDKNELKVSEKTAPYIRGAGCFNFLLNQEKNKKYRMKYKPLGSADKVKWYYTTDKNFDVFAYPPGQFPGEFALPIDREMQFDKTLLTFCNKVIEVIGYKPITSSLCYTSSLF